MQSFSYNYNANSIRFPESSMFSVLSVVSKILYFFSIIPFKVTVEDNGLRLKTSRVHRVVCCTAYAFTFTIISKISYDLLRNTKLSGSSAENPIIMAKMGTHYVSTITMCHFMANNFWISSKVQKFFFDIWKCYKCPPRRLKFVEVVAASIVCISPLFLFSDMIQNFIQCGIKTLDDNLTGFETLMGIGSGILRSENLFFLWPYRILVSFGMLYLGFIYWIATLVFPSFVCCIFYKVGSDAEQILLQNQNQPVDVEFVISLYSATEQLVTDINSSVGINLVLGTVGALVSFSYTILIMIDPLTNFTTKLTYSITVIIFLICFGLAAEGGSKLRVFNEFMFENRQRPGYKDNLEVSLLASKPPLCLKAFKFDITYGFLVNNMSVVLTYAIVLLQFQINSENTSS